MEGDIITLQDIYRFDHTELALLPTGVRPEFLDELGQRGHHLPDGLFARNERGRDEACTSASHRPSLVAC